MASSTPHYPSAGAGRVPVRGRKPVLLLVGVLFAGVLCWRFPLFHLVSLEETRARQQPSAAANAETAAQALWQKIQKSTTGAVEVGELFAALAADPRAARQRYGRSLGLSSTVAYFVKGSGRVLALEEDFVRVALTGAGEGREVRLATGLIFGNAVRDGTGLVDVSAYADSQDFNHLSTELNRLVETEVAPALRAKAQAGAILHFSGGLELPDDAAVDVVEIVPVKVEWP